MGRARGLPGGVVGAFPSKRRIAGTPPARAVSRAPAPAPVVACVEASYGSFRGGVVGARDVSFETETSSKTQSRWRSVPSAGRRSRVPRRRLRRRGEPFGTSALARRGRSAVRGRVGQSPSIHLEPARCRRDARDPILIAEAQRTLPRRHAPPERRRARRLAHGVAGHDLVGFALALAVAAAACWPVCLTLSPRPYTPAARVPRGAVIVQERQFRRVLAASGSGL